MKHEHAIQQTVDPNVKAAPRLPPRKQDRPAQLRHTRLFGVRAFRGASRAKIKSELIERVQSAQPDVVQQLRGFLR